MIIGMRQPKLSNNKVMTDSGISMAESGIAIRFVIMKYSGKLPKYNQAKLPAVIWQDKDKAEISHILRRIGKCFSLVSLSEGQMFFIGGNRYAIPNMAEYESWNPTEVIECGDVAR